MLKMFMRKGKGFTIVELVIVIAVIGILAAVLIPTFSNVIQSANEAAALSEAKSTLESYNSYLLTKGDNLPDGAVFAVDAEYDEAGKAAFDTGYWFVYYEGALHRIRWSEGTNSERITSSAINNDNTKVTINGVEKYCNYHYRPDDIKFTVNGNDYYADCYMYYDAAPITMENAKAGIFAGRAVASNVLYAGGSNPITPETSTPAPSTQVIKNVIYMIPDGAGFGSYDLANLVKQQSTGNTGITGARTPTTTNAISGMTSTGLYLDNFMVGTCVTTMDIIHVDSYITDSAAAATALSTGYKTSWTRVGVEDNLTPHANIMELAQLEGKSTGVVTTKSWVDATPEAFMTHAFERYDADETSYQALNSKVDVMLAYGTDNGTYNGTTYTGHSLRAANKGYTVVNDLAGLNSAVSSGATKLWSNFTEGNDNGANTGKDYSANHISYDVSATASQLSLKDMAVAALTVLANNINDPDGFVLMIEGGAIDNAAEGVNALEAVGDYLAFDEAFAYCVNWAKQRTDTIVVACPDHDSGGFIVPDDQKDTIVNTIISKSNTADSLVTKGQTGHTAQNVPLWVYAPDWCRSTLLSNMGLAAGGNKDNVRTGKYYSLEEGYINPTYSIDNTAVVRGIVATMNVTKTLDQATDMLFVDASPYGNYDEATKVFTFTNGETVRYGDNTYTDGTGTHSFTYGRSIMIALDSTATSHKVYVPRCFLVEKGYIAG